MNKHPSNVRSVKHFLLGAGLALVITFSASSVFAQSLAVPLQGGLMPCASLGGKMVTGQECDTADSASGVKPTTMAPACISGQLSTPSAPCTPQAGTQQNLQPMQQGIDPMQQQTPQINSQNQQFNQQQFLPQQQNQNFQPTQPTQPTQQNQQPLFGQQQFQQVQQSTPQISVPGVKNSGSSLVEKGLKLAIKMESSLASKYAKAKGRTKKLAAVRSIAKKLPTLCRYISSGDDEAVLDENAFDCDTFVADQSEPIAEALKAKDDEVAYDSTVSALEAFAQVFQSLQQ